MFLKITWLFCRPLCWCCSIVKGPTVKTIFADLLVRVSSPFWIKQNHSNPICCYSKCLYMSIYTLPSYIEPTWGNRKHYGASILTKRATKASLLNLREFSLLFLSQSYRLCSHISYEYILKKIGLSLLLNKNYSLRLYIFNIFSSTALRLSAINCNHACWSAFQSFLRWFSHILLWRIIMTWIDICFNEFSSVKCTWSVPGIQRIGMLFWAFLVKDIQVASLGLILALYIL